MAMLNKGSFDIQLQGHTPANRDATVRLVNQATGQTIERKPFLDGSLIVRDIDPGLYQMEVRHPNLLTPITQRTIRLIPQITPTRIPVHVPPDLFRDTPIRDIPDADLTPVQQATAETKAAIQPIAMKAPGEVIRASDWNALAGAVQELANAVLQLTDLVSARGHAHPELEEKFDEVQGNIRRFAEAFGRSLLELRRDIEARRLRQNVEDVLTTAGASDAVRTRIFDRVTLLERNVQADTSIFTSNLTQAGNLLLTEINELANAQGSEAQTFLELPAVQQLTQTARTYSTAGTQVQPEAELTTYTRTMTATLQGRF